MLVIWRGEGWAVLAIYLASFGVVLAGVVWLVPGGSAPGFAGAHAWPMAIAHALAGGVTVAWGLLTNWRPPIEVIDPQTGMRRIIRVRHSLYFIPVEYWGAASLVGAGLCFYLLPQ